MTRTALTLALALGLTACARNGAGPAAAPARVASADPLPEVSLYRFDAAWTSHRGGSVRLVSFRGRPALVAMTFTNCTSACPLIVRDMKAMAQRVSAGARVDVRFVLVSLDPARDTPEAMAHFAAAHGLGAEWTLLRGAPADVQVLANLLDVRYRLEPDGQIAHANLIHVLDPDGRPVARLEGIGADPSAAVAALERALGRNG